MSQPDHDSPDHMRETAVLKCHRNQVTSAASTAQSISYCPLETPQTIRLISARGRNAEGVIQMCLSHFALDDPSCPPFAAVSYVWGDKRLHRDKVIINECACQVLESIHPILALVCDRPTLWAEKWFWIDYICINQVDARERSNQVALMGKLYTHASLTLVWLGESTPTLVDATAVLIRISAWRPKASAEYYQLRLSVASEQWKAVRHWMTTPWWTRVWTLQEFILPCRLVFHCGHAAIGKTPWYNAVINISNCAAIENVGRDAFSNQWTRRRLTEWHDISEGRWGKREDLAVSGMSLVAMMAYTGFYQAGDDRDRMYALLGVCTDIDREIVGLPDYGLSVEETYTRLVVNFIRQHQSLDIICLRAMFDQAQARSSSKHGGILPSWVPDWRCWSPGASRPVPSMVSQPGRQHIGNLRSLDSHHGLVDDTLNYEASANLPAQWKLSVDSRRLNCKGYVVDTIDGLGPVGQSPSDVDSDSTSTHILVHTTSEINTKHRTMSSDTSSAIVECLVRSLSLDRAGRYLMSPANVPGYVRQLRQIAFNSLSQLHTRQQDVKKWYLANKSLCITGASLSGHLLETVMPQVLDADDARNLWEAADMTIGNRSWDCRLVITEQGHLGMAPAVARKGDIVVGVHRVQCPFGFEEVGWDEWVYCGW